MVKKAPLSDNRNDIVSVYDCAGVEFKHTLTNAREMVRNCRWTMNKAEGAARRAEPVEAPVLINDGSPKPAVVAVVVETPVWEDLTVIDKVTLRKVAQYLKAGDLDGRSSEKRIVSTLDSLLDQRLAATGDFDGSDPLPQNADDDVIAAHTQAAIARRRRAYALAATNAGLKVGEKTTLAELIGSFAALVPEATE
jgi:hypothetical protein